MPLASVPPASPCVNICALDAHGYCIGCYRTIEEIASWQHLTVSEQRAVLRLLGERAAERGPKTK
ncbi:MAG: DUF1289 domain-containing protein [Steroidobacteraceae bacterium]